MRGTSQSLLFVTVSSEVFIFSSAFFDKQAAMADKSGRDLDDENEFGERWLHDPLALPLVVVVAVDP